MFWFTLRQILAALLCKRVYCTDHRQQSTRLTEPHPLYLHVALDIYFSHRNDQSEDEGVGATGNCLESISQPWHCLAPRLRANSQGSRISCQEVFGAVVSCSMSSVEVAFVSYERITHWTVSSSARVQVQLSTFEDTAARLQSENVCTLHFWGYYQLSGVFDTNRRNSAEFSVRPTPDRRLYLLGSGQPDRRNGNSLQEKFGITSGN
jgi:hypothetical protein